MLCGPLALMIAIAPPLPVAGAHIVSSERFTLIYKLQI
jgi:hypothetical protein